MKYFNLTRNSRKDASLAFCSWLDTDRQHNTLTIMQMAQKLLLVNSILFFLLSLVCHLKTLLPAIKLRVIDNSNQFNFELAKRFLIG